MAIEIKIPPSGESITSASVGSWHKRDGDRVAKGDTLVTIETDKVSNELTAESPGVLRITVAEGQEVAIGAVIGHLEPIEATAAAPAPPAPAPAPPPAAPAVPIAPVEPAAPVRPPPDLTVMAGPVAAPVPAQSDSRTTRRKLSPLRRKIATHLVNAQQTAAILTTFNEVDMGAVMRLRKDLQDEFLRKHGVKLGFMSFFLKAVTQALRDVPQINARIDGTDLVEHHYYDIGVAVGTDKGLVVPVIRDVDRKSFADLERNLADFAARARDGRIQLDDLQGGVFTISNGGVYGSLLSTPILNPPQCGILGMHTIQQRPVAVDGQVVIRPMMYLALSYDHRLVDGREAVTFLIRVKECLENPGRLMLGV
jgi:2-oxoglutarate dehydrogenase E2 component (dihydrolipoamide succinyltransferase)